MRTLIFDTETTDLIKNKLLPLDRQPHIIEFFGLSVDTEGNECNSLGHLFDPGIPIGDVTTRITGIKPEDLRGKPRFSVHAEELKKFIEGHDEVVAHNLSYDKSMVDFEMKRAGLTVEWPELICTVEATEHIKGHRLNLTSLHELLMGEAFSGAHRAEADVRALANCFRALRETGVV
jgi:DNA polymerase III epsilon subunit-like protein